MEGGNSLTHNLSIKGNTLMLDEIKIKGLLGYNLNTQVDQDTGNKESILTLRLNVTPVDVQLVQ